MSKTQQIIDAIETERSNGLNASEAEVLRYAVWAVWGDVGPAAMSSTEWADACATVGIKRGTAMNRHSEARRNWEAMNG